MRSWKHTLLTRIFRRPPARPSRPAPGIRFRPVVAGLEDRVVPAADLFADATPLVGSFVTDVGSNVGTTSETGEGTLTHANGDASSGEVNSVWWAWTAPATGQFEVNTFGSGIDTVLAVYTGSDLDGGLTEVVSNDDFDPNAGILQSRAVFDAMAGTTYRFAVDGFGAETGDIYLNLGGVPTNDDAANATVVAGGTVTGSNVQATAEAGEPSTGTNGVVNTVWWAWTPAESGAVTIDTFGSPLDTVLAVYTGTPGSLELVADNDDAGESFQSEVTFQAVTGQTYYVSVDGFLHFTGAITLNLPDAPESPPPVPPSPPPPPANTAPTLGDVSVSVNENSSAGTVVADLDATDPDAGQTLTYAITGGNANGAFAIDSVTGVITVADPAALDFETTSSLVLTVTVTDDGTGALSDSATVTVTLRDANDAPVLSNPGPVSLATINRAEASNRGTRVADLVAGVGVTDQDAGAVRGIAVVAANTANGGWQFSTNGGRSWSPLGAVSGSAARLLAADTLTRVRFVPNPGFEGTVAGGLTFRAWDRTTGVNGGTANAAANLAANASSSSFSAATATADVRVRPVAEQLQLLNDQVQAMVTAGTLNPGPGNALRARLDTVQQQLGRGNTNAALNALNGFAAQVIVFVFNGNLSLAQGLELLDAALALRTSILS